MIPTLIKGNRHDELRGTLFYNNDFEALAIKRIYVIENKSIDIIRGWRGHKIEQRWFSAIQGSFKIELIIIDDWETPSKKLQRFTFVLDSTKLDVLHIPSGCVTSIQSVEEGSKLLVMADYMLGEVEDEYRFSVSYFE
ncbi:WxcM-like domain-containing protein [Flavobacterium sp.]|uniref:WxcM-like domain-containing protein n=1 Tax=Flavobacterium sp. TaxID=239 RepID=UPI00286D7D2F|nr:WxcM-like domain-containing protein [Flavobacterium sp.]